jgi:hypothetical protein
MGSEDRQSEETDMDDTTLVGLVLVEAFFFIIRLWALVRVLTRPAWAFERAGTSKLVWVLALVVALLLPVIGYVLALWYLFSTDRRVLHQQRLGPGIGRPAPM